MTSQLEGSHHVRKRLDRYLIPTESVIFVVRRHWIVLTEPVLTTTLALIPLVLLLRALDSSPMKARLIPVALWVFLLGRLLFKIHEWMEELFLATNRRLMLIHGLITRSVDIMPMSKVTDMRYDRSALGKLVGYGIYILESAGQDQALSEINFIPDPDEHYKEISAVLFAPSQKRLPDQMTPAATGSKVPIGEPEQAWWRRP